jgi:transcriptional regulator with XRE-family HTH domain
MAAKNPDFTERLKQAIVSTGLKYPAFAEKAGMPYSTLMSYLKRSAVGHVAEWDQLVKISNAAGKSVDWLLTGEDAELHKKCPTCGNWSDDVRDACRQLQEIMDSGDKKARDTILNNLDLIGRGMEKRGGRKSKKDVPQTEPDAALPARKRKQTAAS